MTDATTAPTLADVLPEVLAAMRQRGLKDWSLTVTDARSITPRMRRVTLTADDLDAFQPQAGQDVVLMLPADDGLGRRHYSVRRFDPAARRIDIDVVMHGESTPGARWAREAAPGDSVLAFGPRGRNVINPGADWRLFIGDETGLPPIFAMLEALPAGAKAHAIIEVATDDERQQPASAADVTIDWVSRGGAPAQASSPGLIARAAAYALPAGHGHAYVLGETSTIRRLRHDLLARGLDKGQIFGEGYWRPGRFGGHDHLEER
jgi:NADPH-dependent ferric siderophore reductase